MRDYDDSFFLNVLEKPLSDLAASFDRLWILSDEVDSMGRVLVSN